MKWGSGDKELVKFSSDPMRVARIDNGNGNAVRGLVSLQAVPHRANLPQA